MNPELKGPRPVVPTQTPEEKYLDAKLALEKKRLQLSRQEYALNKLRAEVRDDCEQVDALRRADLGAAFVEDNS